MSRRSAEDSNTEQGKALPAVFFVVLLAGSLVVGRALGENAGKKEALSAQPGIAAPAPSETTTALPPLTLPPETAPTTVATTVAPAPPTTKARPVTTAATKPAVTAPPTTAAPVIATSTDFPIPGTEAYGGQFGDKINNAGLYVIAYDTEVGSARLELYPNEDASNSRSGLLGVYGAACVMHNGTKALEVIRLGGGRRFDTPTDDPAIADICNTVTPFGSPSTLKPLNQLIHVPLPEPNQV